MKLSLLQVQVLLGQMRAMQYKWWAKCLPTNSGPIGPEPLRMYPDTVAECVTELVELAKSVREYKKVWEERNLPDDMDYQQVDAIIKEFNLKL